MVYEIDVFAGLLGTIVGIGSKNVGMTVAGLTYASMSIAEDLLRDTPYENYGPFTVLSRGASGIYRIFRSRI